jgi:hypothetical protein
LILRRGPETDWFQLNRWEKQFSNLRENFFGRHTFYRYENIDVLPRFFFADRVRTFDGKEPLLDALSDMAVSELRRTMLLNISDPALDRAVARKIGRASLDAVGATVVIELEESDRFELSVSNIRPAIMVWSASYSPFWTCRVDGRRVSVLPAYHALMGLFVPAGAQQILCVYDPPYRLSRFLRSAGRMFGLDV